VEYRTTPRKPIWLLSGLVYFSGIFTPKRCGDMCGFGVHSILSNPLKYSFLEILYHD
jgi:hypothetical protein